MNKQATESSVAVSASPPSPAHDGASKGSVVANVVVSHLAERSVLLDPGAGDLKPFVVGGRKRLATCSGVAWFGGYHLAVVNLYGRHLRVYRFHPGGDAGGAPGRLELLHEISENITYPEDVAVSPDGALLAITHSMSKDLGVSLRPIDPVTHAPSPAVEELRKGTLGSAFHGVRFSPDSRHLAFTEVGNPGYVEVVRVTSPQRERTCLLENRHAPLKPKSIAFSRDGRFVVIAMSQNIFQKEEAAAAAMLSVHRFDAADGVIAAHAVAEFHGAANSLENVEMCTFLHTPYCGETYRILVANQAADVVAAFEFDAERATLAFDGIFAAGLSFPHGLDVSADGRFAAIANYGDDTLRIACISSSVGVAPG